MAGMFTVNNQTFQWWEITRTTQFPKLLRPLYGVNETDVLRILGEDSVFDIAIRINKSVYAGGVEVKWLGPVLVIGNAFPVSTSPIASGSLIRLRPKLTSIPEKTLNVTVAARIVQWVLSNRFRPVCVNTEGSVRWRNSAD